MTDTAAETHVLAHYCAAFSLPHGTEFTAGEIADIEQGIRYAQRRDTEGIRLMAERLADKNRTFIQVHTDTVSQFALSIAEGSLPYSYGKRGGYWSVAPELATVMDYRSAVRAWITGFVRYLPLPYTCSNMYS